MKSLVESILSSTNSGGEELIKQKLVDFLPDILNGMKHIKVSEITHTQKNEKDEDVLIFPLYIDNVSRGKNDWSEEVEVLFKDLSDTIKNQKEIGSMFTTEVTRDKYKNDLFILLNVVYKNESFSYKGKKIPTIFISYMYEESNPNFYMGKKTNSLYLGIPIKYIGDKNKFLKKIKYVW